MLPRSSQRNLEHPWQATASITRSDAPPWCAECPVLPGREPQASLRQGKLITPGVGENIFEGLTRSAVIELARRETQIDVVERPVHRSELYVSDEVFFSGTAVEMAPVVGVDRRPVGSGEPGPVTTELRRPHQAATRGRLPAYANWLVPVYHPAALDRVA
jgi:hypothetical protein